MFCLLDLLCLNLFMCTTQFLFPSLISISMLTGDLHAFTFHPPFQRGSSLRAVGMESQKRSPDINVLMFVILLLLMSGCIYHVYLHKIHPLCKLCLHGALAQYGVWAAFQTSVRRVTRVTQMWMFVGIQCKRQVLFPFILLVHIGSKELQ